MFGTGRRRRRPSHLARTGYPSLRGWGLVGEGDVFGMERRERRLAHDAASSRWEAAVDAGRGAAEASWLADVVRDGGAAVLVDAPYPDAMSPNRLHGPAPVLPLDGSWYAVMAFDLPPGMTVAPDVGPHDSQDGCRVCWGQDLRELRQLNGRPTYLTVNVHVCRLARSPFDPPTAADLAAPRPARFPVDVSRARLWDAVAATTGGVAVRAEYVGSVQWPDPYTMRVPTPRVMLELWRQACRITAAAWAPLEQSR